MRLQRIIAIIMLLLQKEKITAKELAQRFDVSIRTIYRDIDYISASGIPIMAMSGIGGGICIVKEYKIEKGIFSTTDLVSILRGLGFLSENLFDKQLKVTLEKIYALTPTLQQQCVKDKAKLVSIDTSGWKDNSAYQNHVKAIYIALKNKQVITFNYYDRYGFFSKRIVEPHHLVFKEQYWYLLGYCLKRENFRHFNWLRISDLHISKHQFIMRKVPALFNDFTQKVCQKILPIKLRIHASILGQVLQHCSQDNIIKENDEYYLVDFDFTDDLYGYNVLMSFGEHCQCLEPRNVIKELIHKLNTTLALYLKT